MTPVREAPHFPVTVGTALLAIGVTFAWWDERDIGVLLMSPRAFFGEPWRLLSSTLPHADVLHLLFNVLWLWVFGSYAERAFGHVRTAALFVALGVLSAAAEYALFRGGVGLSGIGFGLCAFLWASARHDPRYADAMDARTVQLFMAWGVLCVVLTIAGVWHVANVAHGVGFACGFGIGFARTRRGRGAALAWGGLLAGALVVAAGATALRPLVNIGDRGAIGHCHEGWRALERGDDALALALLDEAARYPAVSPGCFYNHGIALLRAGREDEAQAVIEEALRRDPSLAPASARAPAGGE